MQAHAWADSEARPLLNRSRIVSQANMHNSPWTVKRIWSYRIGVLWTVRRKVLAFPDLSKSSDLTRIAVEMHQ